VLSSFPCLYLEGVLTTVLCTQCLSIVSVLLSIPSMPLSTCKTSVPACMRRLAHSWGTAKWLRRCQKHNRGPYISITYTKLCAQQEQGAKPDAFDWVRQWYPLAFVEDLDPGRPHAVELLGKRLVLWRDAQQQWRAFEDRCPHRLAPLSGVRPF
jgi:hypothetical protein